MNPPLIKVSNHPPLYKLKKINRENQNLNLFKKTPIFYKSKKELDNLCGRDETAHQGLEA